MGAEQKVWKFEISFLLRKKISFDDLVKAINDKTGVTDSYVIKLTDTVYVAFARKADSLDEALMSAIDQIMASGLRVKGGFVILDGYAVHFDRCGVFVYRLSDNGKRYIFKR